MSLTEDRSIVFPFETITARELCLPTNPRASFFAHQEEVERKRKEILEVLKTIDERFTKTELRLFPAGHGRDYDGSKFGIRPSGKPFVASAEHDYSQYSVCTFGDLLITMDDRDHWRDVPNIRTVLYAFDVGDLAEKGSLDTEHLGEDLARVSFFRQNRTRIENEIERINFFEERIGKYRLQGGIITDLGTVEEAHRNLHIADFGRAIVTYKDK